MVAAARDPDSGGGLAGLRAAPWPEVGGGPAVLSALGRCEPSRGGAASRSAPRAGGQTRKGEGGAPASRGSYGHTPWFLPRGPGGAGPLKLALCAVVPLKVRETRAWPGVRPGGGLRRAAAVPAALGRGFRFPFKQKTLLFGNG